MAIPADTAIADRPGRPLLRRAPTISLHAAGTSRTSCPPTTPATAQHGFARLLNRCHPGPDKEPVHADRRSRLNPRLASLHHAHRHPAQRCLGGGIQLAKVTLDYHAL